MTTIEDAIAGSEHKNLLTRTTNRQLFWVFLAAVVACAALTLVTDTFATERNLFNVARNFAFVGIVALGMTMVIASGGIDLSVGSSVVLSAMVISVLMAGGMGLWLAAPLALGSTLLVGLLNGILIAYGGMPPFVVTLGTLSAVRSLAMVLSNNKMMWEFGPDHNLLLWIGGGSTLGIPHPLYALTLLTVIVSLASKWTRWGQYVFAIGGNESAATLAGIPVKRIKVSIYMFSAFTAGVTGILMAGWLGSVTTNLGQAMELTVIAAAVIGGANLAGGEGTAIGAVIGALLIEVIRNSMILLGISTFWQGMFIGTFIIVAVAFDRIRHFRS
ncbi:MAG TPA: ABC transporter permease [Rhizobium sp.]|nr:ABC transporter permease [Rhizobium sp.]